MSNNELCWSEKPCERYVAFLDIMGFKDRYQRLGHNKMGELLSIVRDAISEVEELPQKISSTNEPKNMAVKAVLGDSEIRPVLFSDSIILITNDDSKGSVLFILNTIEYLFSKALSLKIPMKGAIAWGLMTANTGKSLFFGQPLIDAVELQKELQLYGVILHHTVEEKLNQLNLIKQLEKKDFFQYPTPLKTSRINHYLVDWISINAVTKQDISQLYYGVSGNPRKYVDNTLEFLEFMEKEKAKETAQNNKTT